jgi:hypothetical protein
MSLTLVLIRLMFFANTCSSHRVRETKPEAWWVNSQNHKLHRRWISEAVSNIFDILTLSEGSVTFVSS